jgi:methoxymalonate biosynthesis acyl carrier protein
VDDKAKIRAFITGHVRQDQAAADGLADDADIFALGLVNSMFVVQLVSFVEKEFDLTVSGADLDFANFQSVDAVGRLVSRLAAA